MKEIKTVEETLKAARKAIESSSEQIAHDRLRKMTKAVHRIVNKELKQLKKENQ